MPSTLPSNRVRPVLQALCDENRLRIIEELRRGECCVCDLQSQLGLGQSLLSHHLGVLREADLVSDRREGRWVHYSLIPEAFEAVARYFEALRADAATAPIGTGRC